MRADQGFVRALGVRQVTASIINTTIGGGIFVLPAVAVATLGAAAPLAYVVCGVLMALIVCCFAGAGSRVSLTGGLYAYVEVAFGPFVGFLAGVLYALMAAFAVASVASAFAGSVGALWSGANAGPIRALLLVALFGGLAAVNVRGVKLGARVIEVMTAAKLLPLVVFVAAGIWSVNPDYLRWPAMPDPSQIGRAAIVLIFAFVGVEIALVPSGEIRDPARTLPRALFLALAITTTLYLLIQATAQGLLGPSMSAYAAAPLAEAAARVLGAGGRVFVLVGAIVSMFGYVSGDMLGSPRAWYAFGRAGVLPAAMARIHPRYHTPHVAIVVYACIVATLAISSSFTQLAVLANVAALTLYLMCVVASFELQRRDIRSSPEPLRSANAPSNSGGGGVPAAIKESRDAPFTLAGGPVIPVAAAAVILWVLSNATRREFAVEAAVLTAASLLYAIRAWNTR